MRLREAARVLDCGRTAIYKMINRGKLRSVRLPYAGRRVYRSEVLRLAGLEP